MKPRTTQALIATVLVTAFAGVSATAIAQNTAPPVAAQTQTQPHAHGAAMDTARMAERRQAMQARMSERHARHLERLKAELKLSPEQEAAWQAFVARTQPQPLKAPAAAQDWSSMTTPQRLDAQQALYAERGAAMAQRIEATKSFYAQLTAEQQKTFDAQSRGHQRTGMKGDDRHGGKGYHGAHHGGHHGAYHGGQHGMGGGMGGDAPMNGHSGHSPRN